MKKQNKLMLLVIAVMASVFMIPNVSAAEVTSYGAVKDITGEVGDVVDKEGYTAQNAVYSDKKQEVTITFDQADLKNVKAAPELGREDVAAWLGLHIAEPEGGSFDSPYWEGGIKPGQTQFTKDTGEGTYQGKYTIWVKVTADELKEALEKDGENATITKTYIIHWGGQDNDDNNQTINVVIKASGVTLKNDDEVEATEWTKEESQAAIATYNEAHKAPVEPTEEPEQNPDTADINLYLILGMLAFASCGLVLTVRKRFN